jgi:hypothetical protein
MENIMQKKEEIICPKCKSTDFNKIGVSDISKRSVYRCNNCRIDYFMIEEYRLIEDKGESENTEEAKLENKLIRADADNGIRALENELVDIRETIKKRTQELSLYASQPIRNEQLVAYELNNIKYLEAKADGLSLAYRILVH